MSLMSESQSYQSDYNSTNYYDPNYCECNMRGICVDGPVKYCSCDVGFGGVNEQGLPTCEDTWITINPSTFTIYRSLCIIFTTIALVYTVLNSLYYYIVVTKNQKNTLITDLQRKYTVMCATVARTSKVVLGVFSIWLTFDWIIWVFDPMSYYSVLPYGVYRYFVDCGVVMGNIYILALLEHVVKFTHYSLASLKKNELYKKINSNYTKEVTIEQMIEENSKNNTIFWVSICINGPLALLQLIATITHSLYMTVSVLLDLIFYIYALILFTVYTISMYFIWKRYISVIPSNMLPVSVIHKVFWKTAAATIISWANTLLAIVISLVYGSWYGAYYYQPITLILKYAATFSALSIFNPPRAKDYLLILGEKGLGLLKCTQFFQDPDPDTDSLSSYPNKEVDRASNGSQEMDPNQIEVTMPMEANQIELTMPRLETEDEDVK